MALPILDGNQSATTLSTILAGGEHTPAHTVVSLGSTAISNITSAVSGSVVSISNFPATQVVSVSNFPATQPVSLASLPASTVTVSNFPSTQTIAGTVTANLAPQAKGPIVEIDSAIPADPKYMAVVGGYNTVDNTAQTLRLTNSGQVMVGSLPAISGTVTANGGNFTGSTPDAPPDKSVQIGFYEVINDNEFKQVNNSGNAFPVQIVAGNYTSTQPISGTVTANVIGTKTFIDNNAVTVSGFLTVGGWDDVNSQYTPLRVNDGGSGVRAVPDPFDQSPFPISGTVTVGNSVTIGSLPAISGTVTVGAVPNGSLTTRFGTPTTANTAFATSAVTNASRKYLLIQNVTTGSNVITVGIGFTPTTTQGIQLTAGAGITFESSYIPTGAVRILSSVTASNFTILEA